MTDLTKGIIEIEGFNLKQEVDVSRLYNSSYEDIVSFGKTTISSNTTKSDLLEIYGNSTSPSSSKRTLKFTLLFIVLEKRFSCTFHFNDNDTIARIELSPCIKYKSEKWDRAGRQEERREFCDKWLYEQLGEPHKVLDGDIEYSFERYSISCFSNHDIRDGGNAGHIVILYKQ